MAQPDNFGFGEEAALLKASARKFFTEKLPTSTLHALVARDHRPERGSECLWDRELWQEMVGLGWTMLAVPEAAGGVGMPAVAVAGLAEELGRAAFPCPLLGMINASYALAACGTGGEQALDGEDAYGAIRGDEFDAYATRTFYNSRLLARIEIAVCHMGNSSQ